MVEILLLQSVVAHHRYVKVHPALFLFEEIQHKAVKSYLAIDIDITLPQATEAITRPGLGAGETP